MIDNWMPAYCGSYLGDTLIIQIDVGCETETKSKKQYVIGADSGLRVRISASKGRAMHTIAITTDREWHQISHLIHYATQSLCDADVGEILGKDPKDIATAMSIYGSIRYNLGRQVTCRILAQMGTQNLPNQITIAVKQYTDKWAKKDCLDDKTFGQIPVVHWDQMSIYYAPYIDGDERRKRWGISVNHAKQIWLTDHEILDLVDQVDAALDATKVTKPK